MEELSELVQAPVQTVVEAQQFAEKLTAESIQVVVVSLGGEGALCVTKGASLYAEAPKGQVINTVGAGDSLVALMVLGISEVLPLEEAFRFGVAAGSATAFNEDLAEGYQIQELVKKIDIKKI